MVCAREYHLVDGIPGEPDTSDAEGADQGQPHAPGVPDDDYAVEVDGRGGCGIDVHVSIERSDSRCRLDLNGMAL